MLNKLILGLENYLWQKVITRMLGRVSAIEGRPVDVGEIIDIEPIVPEALPELTTDKKPSGARTRKRSA